MARFLLPEPAQSWSMQMKGSESCQGSAHPSALLGQGKHTGMKGELWERHHGHRWLNSYCRALQLTQSNCLSSASAIDYLLPFIFPPFSPFLEQKYLLHSEPSLYGLKGGKKDKPCKPNNSEDPEQTLQINVG